MMYNDSINHSINDNINELNELMPNNTNLIHED